MLQNFCTKFQNPPRRYDGPTPELDTDLYQHIRESIEVVLSDSAANESAASNVNRGRRALQIESDTADALLPNLKLVARDHAHSFRHVLQRPFKSSDYLCQLMDNNVLHGNSIVRVIDGSFVFRQWFEIEVGKMGGTAHNLKSDSCHGNK